MAGFAASTLATQFIQTYYTLPGMNEVLLMKWETFL